MIASSSRRARVPIAPVFHLSSLAWPRQHETETLLDVGAHVLTTSGRAALTLALRQLDIGAGDEVLVPAYRCLAMTAPIAACGATPVSYPLHMDLTVDLQALTARRSARTRCVIAVHYFGFPQDFVPVRQWCDEHGVALIEDCAHAFYTRGQSYIGRTGDYSIGSLMKFFPLFDGGCLVAGRRKLRPLRMVSKGANFELKVLVDTMERSAQWSTAPLPCAALKLANVARAALKSRNPESLSRASRHAPSAAEGSIDLQEEWIDVRMSLTSRILLRWSDHGRAAQRRRNLYQRYLDALQTAACGHPLYPALPGAAVPYVFPFVLHHPEGQFTALWEAGVPMYRWEDVDVSACETAAHYHSRLVQFPCHQELTDTQMDWLISTVEYVLKAPPTDNTPQAGQLPGAEHLLG